MTLAVILLVISSAISATPLLTAETAGQSSAQPAPANIPASAPPAQKPSSAQQPSSSGAPTQASPGQNKPTAAKPRPHKKKVVASNCVSAPATVTGSAPSGSAPAGVAATDPPAAASNPAPGTPNLAAVTPSKNCPPPKIIVRQGGTSEPTIQLAGGAVGDQAAHQRDTANQMLGSTEENLKKLAGRQLSQNQQDMVNQVHQFMAQSKTAVKAGDLERARTLAWKAQLLSEELVKPPQ